MLRLTSKINFTNLLLGKQYYLANWCSQQLPNFALPDYSLVFYNSLEIKAG